MTELSVARAAALAAGDILRRHAGRGPAATLKADGSPVTEADLEANRVILARLREAFPADAILSEESPAPRPDAGAGRVWLVDPLDGTRDFLAGSAEFAVHVALTVAGRPVVSVVYLPATDRLFEAVAGEGAFRRQGDRRERLTVSTRSDPGELRVGVSRLAPGAPLQRLLAESPLGPHAVPMGASAKLVAVAEGSLDATLCLHGREQVWDSCAPALIVTEAGGRVTDVDGRPLRYDLADLAHRRGIVTSNGRCHDALCALAARYWPAA